MQSDKERQLVALLQDAGVLAAYEVEKALTEQRYVNGNLLQTLLASGALSFEALQEVLLQCGQSAVALQPALVHDHAAFSEMIRCVSSVQP
jgi:hypothetical protein